MTDTLHLAQALIARPSVTPEDAGCQELLAGRLEALGFTVERLRFGVVDNLWAVKGREGPLVCLAGHTDVVPTGPAAQWRYDPFSATVADGQLHGRGAADMKTSLAAFVTGVETFLREHPDHPGSIALLLTSDEEGDAVDGTVRVVEELRRRGQRIDYCIVGEPTCAERFGDTIKNGRRGSLSGHLVVHGVQGHVAYPHLAQNPVHLAAPAIAELAQTVWDQGDEYFPPTTWQVSNARAGTGATNVIPGDFDLRFNFRFSTASTVEGLQARLEEVLCRHGLRYSLNWTLSGKPFLTPRGRLVGALSRAVEAVTGLTPELSTSGGTSDGRFLAEICPEVVEFGPVNRTIHKLDERVDLSEVDALRAVYARALAELLVAP